MTTLKNSYQAVQNLTFTSLVSLAAGNAAVSAYIDNTTTQYDDILVQLKIPFVSDPGNSYIDISVYGSLDGANWFGESLGIAGTDSVIASPNNRIQNGMFADYEVPTSSGITKADIIFPVIITNSYNWLINANTVPPYWGIIVTNHTSVALNNTGFITKYQGSYSQAV